jgi:hypothetical protein
MLYVMCWCILALSRIPNMTLGDKPLISEMVLLQLKTPGCDYRRLGRVLSQGIRS